MKMRMLQISLLPAVVASLLFAADSAVAQEPTAVSAAPQLSYGVPQVLQLAQAKVGDDVIVHYIQNSGTIYAMRADEIVYLKQQGVSETVLNAMLNQRVRLTGSTEPATAPASSATTVVASDQSYATTVPPTAYIQTVPSSTVYIIPDTQTYRYNSWYYGGYPYSYYDYYPYGYYGYYDYPAVSFSFGFGNRWGGYRDGGWHGGGGWYRSGGWHNSGGWHGGGGWHR